jgi:2',3'-cyclic-nucleotide 2'-phosphodiesterase (5'-nucleotidase family)
MIEEVRAREGEVILLDSGDGWHDYYNLGWSFLKGEPLIRWMNEIGYDAVALGNHDLYNGLERLKVNAELAEFPLLSANIEVLDPRYKGLFEPFIFKEVGGLDVLLVGLTTTEYFPHQTLLPLLVHDPIKTLKPVLDEVKGADLIVVVGHISIEKAVEIAQAVPQIDLFFSGHSHIALKEPLVVGNTYIFQAGKWGRYLGVAEVMVDQEGKIEVTNSLIPVENTPEDLAEVWRIRANYRDEIFLGWLKALLGLGAVLLPLLIFL